MHLALLVVFFWPLKIVSAQQYCFSTDEETINPNNFGTKTSYHNVIIQEDADLFKIADDMKECKQTKMWILMREAPIFPDAAAVKKFKNLKNVIINIAFYDIPLV